MSERAALIFGCVWLVLAVGQAYLAGAKFERGDGASSPWFNVAFAGAYACFALVYLWRYWKLKVDEAAAFPGSARR